MNESGPRALLIDLNNFARYPTLSVGLLAAVLRGAAYEVAVFAPLMVGVPGVTREARPHALSLVLARLNHRIAVSQQTWLRRWRDRWASRRLSAITRERSPLVEAVAARIAQQRPSVVLISSYLMYRDLCGDLVGLCHQQGIPVLLGGPYFVQSEVQANWARLPGLTALIAGEVELTLPAILDTVLAGGDLGIHDGVIWCDQNGEVHGRVARPLKQLDEVPVPDYSDFPWSAYPNRMLSVITGRGCAWGACSFCSDVTSNAGRTYRTRSLAHVMTELKTHRDRHGVSRFVFTDMKLNSDLAVWRGLLRELPEALPDTRWIASVHVGSETDHGLSEADLRDAAAAGCVRLTTGLETGSQRLADEMKKGTRLDRLSAFFHHAAAADISVRTTMILGHPTETAEDVHASADFLARHRDVIERVSLNRLSLMMGTVLHRELQRKPMKFKGFEILSSDPRTAQLDHRHEILATRAHQQAVDRLLAEVHHINARPLRARARDFEGVM